MNIPVFKKIAVTIPAFLLFCFFSCALDIPDDANDELAPPVITNCYQSGSDIIVQFRGYNNEYYFEGYNVYTSNVSMLKSSIASYHAVQIADDGYASAVPSYPLSPDDYDPDLIRQVTLDRYTQYQADSSYEDISFSNGTYYIRFCSYHKYNGVDEEGVSNQVTITLSGI